jgi:hypothetical protein
MSTDEHRHDESDQVQDERDAKAREAGSAKDDVTDVEEDITDSPLTGGNETDPI